MKRARPIRWHVGTWSVAVRRVVGMILMGATTFLGTVHTHRILAANGMSPLEWAMLGLAAVLFVPLAISFWVAFFGLLIRLGDGDTLELTRPLRAGQKRPPPRNRTAIVIPIYNEDPRRVFAGVEATHRSLARTGSLASFDFFVLSDTNDPDIWVEEEVLFDRLQAALGGEHLWYRNRPRNLERKVGNIEDFCARFGDAYESMIVLDADSVMSGDTLVALVELMEEHPEAGIIQTPPIPVNRDTLFGRLHQFAARVYGWTFITGLNFFQAGEGNYWGHNAIIRIRPFIEHCRLPRLSGREPLGGSILSHDFIEAAFMRRAGWKVYLASGLDGSYEEVPPTLIDYAARDRRWCQGNLQHARLLFLPGLNFLSRVHLFMGVMSYVSSPLWLALVALSTAEALRERLSPHEYFAPDRTLFPIWEVSVISETLALFFGVMGLLFLPKLFSLALLLRDRGLSAVFGGRGRLATSVVIEMLFSMLLAPPLAYLRTRFVLAILLGKKIEWNAQNRADAATTWRMAARRHGGITLLGLAWGTLVWMQAPELFWWLSPFLAGFVFSIPLSALSSRRTTGRWTLEHGWLRIPEEIDPPEVLRTLHARLAATGSDDASPRGFVRLLSDDAVRRLHASLLPAPPERHPLERHHLDGLVLRLRYEGPESLSSAEKRELLLDPKSVEALADIELPPGASETNDEAEAEAEAEPDPIAANPLEGGGPSGPRGLPSIQWNRYEEQLR